MSALFLVLLACSGTPAEPVAQVTESAAAPTAEGEGNGQGVEPSEGREAAGAPAFIDIFEGLEPAAIEGSAKGAGCVGMSESQPSVYDDGTAVWFGTRDGVIKGELVNTRGTVRYFSVGGSDIVLDVQGDKATVAEADEDSLQVPMIWTCTP